MSIIRVSNLLFLVFFISSCGGGGSSSSSVNSITNNNITIDFQPSLSDAPVGSEITLTWSSDNTTGCQASNGWSGLKSTSGSEIMQVSNKSGANTYTLTCFNGTHSTISTSTVNSRNVNQTEAFHFLNQATFVI